MQIIGLQKIGDSMLLAVIEVEHYTDTLFRIRTERPNTYRFTAGEFVMISMEDTPKRAYSISSGPYDDYIEFYSIKVPDGPLTSKLQNIKVGDMLEVGEKPTGTLLLANLELGGHLVMMASGTGIAPFISLLRDPETYDLVFAASKYSTKLSVTILGEYLKADIYQQAGEELNLAKVHNPWFTKENIDKSLSAWHEQLKVDMLTAWLNPYKIKEVKSPKKVLIIMEAELTNQISVRG